MTTVQRFMFESIVFIQGEESNEPLDMLYNREGSSVVFHGPTLESVNATLAYMSAWDYGEPGERTEEPSSGTHDDVWEQDGYRLTANLGLSYIGLERVLLVPDTQTTQTRTTIREFLSHSDALHAMTADHADGFTTSDWSAYQGITSYAVTLPASVASIKRDGQS